MGICMERNKMNFHIRSKIVLVLTLFISMLTLTFFASGCGAGSNEINNTVTNFFTAMNKGDYNAAKLYFFQEGFVISENIDSLKSMLPPGRLSNSSISDLKVNGNSAVATINFETKDGKKYKTKEAVEFHKESDGKWRLNPDQIRDSYNWLDLSKKPS